MVPFYTTVLSVEQFGDASIIQTTANLLTPILTCLISEAVLRYCFFKNSNLNLIFSVGLKFTILASFFALVLIVFASLLLSSATWSNYMWYIPIIVLTYSISKLLHCFCRGIDKVKISAMAGVLQTFVVVSVNLILLGVFKCGIWAYILAFILGDFCGFLYMAVKVKVWRFVSLSYNQSLEKSMLRYSLPLVPIKISWWALSSLNQYIVLIYLGMGAVGVYSATLRIPTLLTVLADIFAQAWLLSALKDYDSPDTKSFIIKMSRLFLVVVVLLSALIIMFSHPIAIVMLKGTFSNYWYIAPLLFVSVFLGAVTGFLGSIFSAERKNIIQATSTVIGAAVSIIVILILIKSIGIIATAVSTLLGYFIITLIRLWGTRRYIKLEISFGGLTLQTLLLITESIFVMKELYLFAILTLCLIICVNFNSIKQLISNFNILFHRNGKTCNS